jgi:hypothetical protein
MKYRVSVNGKRRTREQVSRERHIERVQAKAETVEEVKEEQIEHQPQIEQQQVQVQARAKSKYHVQVRSRKRARTRVAFRMLTPVRPALIYTPMRKELHLPERLLNRMSLSTMQGMLPQMQLHRQLPVQIKPAEQAVKRLRKSKAVLSRSYVLFPQASLISTRMRVRTMERDLRMLAPFKMRRCSAPIRVPPIELGREGVSI